MRRTRFMSLFFLVLSAAFFFTPQFRQAIMQPLVGEFDTRWARWAVPSDATVRQWAQQAEAERDAPTLAFVATRHPERAEAKRLADLAVEIDPEFTWIYVSLYSRRSEERTLEIAQKLQAFDPENAVGYLMEGQVYLETTPELKDTSFPPAEDQAAQLLKYKEWSSAMARAYAAPRYDAYTIRRFRLEREIMQQKGVATPIHMAASVLTYPVPDLRNLRMYANSLVAAGREAEAAGRHSEALERYWTAAHFGERMQLAATSYIEQLIGIAVQRIAYPPLAGLLRQTGRHHEAATVDFAATASLRVADTFAGKDPLTQTSNASWHMLIYTMCLGSMVVFGLLTALSIAYVNLKRWVRPQHKGRLYTAVTVAENYLPLVFFISCWAVFAAYYPYARNFEHYMTTPGQVRNLELVLTNALLLPIALPGGQQIPIGNPFMPYAWYAGVGLLVLVLVSLIGQLKKPKEEPRAKAAQA